MRKSIALILSILFLVSCTKTAVKLDYPKDVSSLSPEDVVSLYFQAWNDKRYEVMYSLISDGFKQIEPTAKNFDEFKAYMSKFYETSSGIEVLEVKEIYNKENETGINYKIAVISKNNERKEFSSTYTLKKRANGWKLIHPYGENIDTT